MIFYRKWAYIIGDISSIKEAREEGIEKNMLELLHDDLLEKMVVVDKFGMSLNDVEISLAIYNL